MTLKKLKHRVNVQKEIFSLNRQIKRCASVEPSRIVHFDTQTKRYIWEILLPSHEPVYMTTLYHQSVYIVHVNALAFYKAWLSSGLFHYQSCRLRHDMFNDRKFNDAVKGFSAGFTNPVPFAEINPSLDNGNLRIGFTNGMTRSLWLLAHSAPTFPVHCFDLFDATMLATHAGIGSPISVDELYLAEVSPSLMGPQS